MNLKLSIVYLCAGSLLWSSHAALADLRREMNTPYVAEAGPALGAVRGRLIRVGRNGEQYPASGIRVTLYHPQMGRSAPSYSGGDGMYAIPNVPAGPYTLEIWTTANAAMLFSITVYPSTRQQPFTDIAPIRVP